VVEMPARTRCRQHFPLGEFGDIRVGLGQVDLDTTVPGQGLVRAIGVVVVGEVLGAVRPKL
jgi:hypothetical protein